MTREDLAAKLRLYLVADPDQSTHGLADAVEAALRGGVTAVQLRWKSATDRRLFEEARLLAALCQAHNALFFVNDRLDIALAAGADGAHLGVDDLPVEAARQLGGPGFLIGYSPETDAQATEAASAGVDYLGVGPVFGTSSKSDAGPSIGLETIKRRVGLAGIPVIGIGGIGATNARDIMRIGAAGVAVVSSILRSPDPEIAARELRIAIDG